jgi:transcriptional regulator with XRE-family HTH domain
MNSEEIKEYRRNKGLTQAELAEIAGVKIGTVQSWEQGKRNIPQSTIKLLQMQESENEVKEEESDRFEDLVAQRVLKEFHPMLQEVFKSHDGIKKEVAKLILDNDDLLDEVEELKEEIISLKKVVLELHKLMT